MRTYDFQSFIDNPTYDALQKIQEQINNSAAAVAMRELQRTIDAAMIIPTEGITAALQVYYDSIAPLTDSWRQQINASCATIWEKTRVYESFYNATIVSALQGSKAMRNAVSHLSFSDIQSLASSFSTYEIRFSDIIKDINFDAVAELYKEGEITDEDIAEELNEIASKKDFSFAETWDNVKKSKWFLAIHIIFVIMMFFSSPVIDKTKDNILEALKVNEFWEESGIYEWLDSVFNVDAESKTGIEQEDKEIIIGKNIENVSKLGQEDLLSKISAIRAFISAAPQDERTENLLSYLSDIEKYVRGQK